MFASFSSINLNAVRGFVTYALDSVTPPPTPPVLFSRYNITAEAAPEQSSNVTGSGIVIEDFLLPEEYSDDTDDTDDFVIIPDPKINAVKALLADFDE